MRSAAACVPACVYRVAYRSRSRPESTAWSAPRAWRGARAASTPRRSCKPAWPAIPLTSARSCRPRYASKESRMRVIIFSFLLACGTTAKPTPTGAVCPDVNNPQYSYANFGYDFNCHYCDNCHDSKLTLNERNGAPLFHNLDTLVGMMDVWQHMDMQAAWGPKAHNDCMPGGGTGGRCPSML